MYIPSRDCNFQLYLCFPAYTIPTLLITLQSVMKLNLNLAGVFHGLEHGGADLSRRVSHVDSSLLHGGDLLAGTALTARDDSTSMA